MVLGWGAVESSAEIAVEVPDMRVPDRESYLFDTQRVLKEQLGDRFKARLAQEALEGVTGFLLKEVLEVRSAYAK